MRRQDGFTVIELLIAIAIIGLTTAIAVPQCQSFGRRCGAYDWQYAVYDDGEGDGVRNDVIQRGVDRRVTGPRYMIRGSELAIAIPSSVRVDPDGAAMLAGVLLAQLGTSTICSFSPLGESTSGTIDLTDAAGLADAVRVFGGTANVRLLRYDPQRRRWEHL